MSTFRQNLTKARSHIIVIFALRCGLFLALHLESVDRESAPDLIPVSMARFTDVKPQPIRTSVKLDEKQMGYARTAWQFFLNNTDPDTGLTGSVDAFPSTTMWETGSQLVAVISAERLGLTDTADAHMRIEHVLGSLLKLQLFEGNIPNKAYDIRSLKMVTYDNKPTDVGLGWSALDIGRLLSALAIVQHAHPDLSPQITTLLAGWDLSRVTQHGELTGATMTDGKLKENQEGRIGYEQYAAKAMLLFGLDATAALDISDTLTVVDVQGLPIPVDSRMNRNKVRAFTTSESYLLDGLEFGFDWRSHIFASEVYRAQELRFAETGKLTAVSEGHLNVKPFFAYATVWGGGQPWAVLTSQGERIDSRRTLSTKAAFGWDALFATDYTQKLVEAVAPFAVPAKGWPEGIYEVSGEVNDSDTANTNALVLAALAYQVTGPLLRYSK